MQKGFAPVLLVILLAIVGIVGAYFIGSQNLLQNFLPIRDAEPMEYGVNIKVSPLPSTVFSTNQQWESARLASFAFEYPFGWHVASIWPTQQGDPIRIVAQLEPIDGAPRDGFPEGVTIVTWNGLPDPETKLATEKANLVRNLQDGYKKESLKVAHGEFEHVIGKFTGEYLGGTQVEHYITLIPATNASDKLNYSVVIFSTYGTAVSPDILKHMALSLKN